MKTVIMSLVSQSGKIVNTWSVSASRRAAALEHAMDRAEQEGHAGVLWAVVNKGKIREFAFDSHDPASILRFANGIHPYMGPGGLKIDQLTEGALVGGAKY